jgi:hypothetical protein
MPSDKTYQMTKQIMLGKKKINPDFKPLADFIDKQFGVKVINIIYDQIDNKIPRLNIHFEFEREQKSFHIKPNDRLVGYDKKKQQIIADCFEQLADKKHYKTKDIWVVYSAFAPVAKIEANMNVSAEEKEKLQTQLGNKDIWTISNAFTSVTFFLYTDEQLKFYEKSPLKKEWADKYREVLRLHDEFGYYKRSPFKIYLDSKENFDKNYDSNWWYYYK